MEAEGSLKLRVVKNIPYPNLDQAIELGIKSGGGSEMLGFGWLKLFADGALGPQTAAMLAPYEGTGFKRDAICLTAKRSLRPARKPCQQASAWQCMLLATEPTAKC